ncbi:hypothetical protein [Micromonospora sp. CA-111912]|uniref:hypothetical protein n=1 Tax=Micromonospora sp. CA-111912 TaxID=3239955 RepID=UPI003D932E36
MIERGSGRTSGLTQWLLMDLLSMWACIQDHDTAGHWKQVAGWRKVCDLAQAHLGRLKEYRRGLAEAWPPATNAAARAYLGELDDLIDKMQRTHDTAAANYDALAAATRAISSARVELKPLHDEYVTKLQQKRTYEATLADPKAAMGSRVPDKPVTDVDLERLNAQARTLMYGLSGELQQAQVMLQRPPVIRPRIDDADSSVASTSTPSAPVIPPIVPVPISASKSDSLMKRFTVSTPHTSAPTAPTTGPILGGTGADLSPPSAKPGIPGTITAPSASGMGAGLPPILPANGKTERPSTPLSRSPFGPTTRPPAGGDGTTHATPARPMPPSGLIGGIPSSGLGQPGGTPPSRRVNPIGGVIGGGGAGTAPGGAAGSRPRQGRASQFGSLHGISPLDPNPSMGRGPGRPSHPEEVENEGHRWDPNHPWETKKGVAPVVRPPDEDGPIDPGPAIGFDR